MGGVGDGGIRIKTSNVYLQASIPILYCYSKTSTSNSRKYHSITPMSCGRSESHGKRSKFGKFGYER